MMRHKEDRLKRPDPLNTTPTAYPEKLCIHQLFEQQAAKTPEGIALIFDKRRLTYGELNARADRLAFALRQSGVGPNTPVGLLIDRSFEMVIAMLAVLKAGGAYVPIDPDYPQTRIDYMLEHTSAPLLLTRAPMTAGLKNYRGRVVDLDNPPATFGMARPESSTPAVTSADLAYIMYTSGSTGLPKGVMIRHRGVINLLQWMTRTYRVTAQSTVVQSTSMCFDVSVWEIFGSLSVGAGLALIKKEVILDGYRFLKQLEAVKATHFSCVPSLYTMLMFSARDLKQNRPALSRLQWFLLAGEALKNKPVELGRSLYPRIRIANIYGPTEATVYASYYHLPDQPESRPIPIGRPLANVQLYIVDKRIRPVPVNKPGELCIGGSGVAAGYWKDPQKTARAFIDNPFYPGTKLYRTGDYVKLLPDGQIAYIGRKDFQFKIRGFRIETGEIEAALSAWSPIKECLVTVAPQDDIPSIRAYYTAQRPIAVGRLRAFLARHLPAYMVPHYFIHLQRMPLNANGKIDRKALPPPAAGRAVMDCAYRAPDNEAEQKLIAIWREVLGLNRIGVKDNFLELGGDSLKALQVVARIGDVFGMPCSIRTLFENPTVTGLLPFISRQGRSAVAEPDDSIKSAGTRTAYELSGAQQGLWLDCRIQSDPFFYNEQSLLPIRGQLDQTLFLEALKKLVAQQSILRTVFTEKNHAAVQKILPAIDPEISMPDFSAMKAAEIKKNLEALQISEFRKPFHLSKGPLFRVSLVRCSPQCHHLLTTLHHLITDDWSQNEFYRRLFSLYNELASGRPDPIPASLPLGYADYSVWHNRLLNSPYGKACRDYWRTNLAGVDQTLDLPYDEPPVANSPRTAASAVLLLGRKQTEQIRSFCVEQNATLFMTLLAVLKALLFRYGGQEDIIVGVPTGLRNRKELEPLLGYFVNMLPIRTHLSGSMPFRECLHQIKQKSLEAFQYRDYPFYRMVADLNPQRNRPGRSLLTVTFQTETDPTTQADPALPAGLDLSAAEWINHLAKYDLSVIARETHGRLRIRFEYPAALFSKTKISRLSAHYGRLMRGLLKDPDRPLQTIDYLSDREMKTLLDRFNRTEALFPVYALTRACVKPAESRDDHPLYRQTDPVLFRELSRQKKYRRWISAKIAVHEINHWKSLKADADIRADEALIRLKFDWRPEPSRTSLQLCEHIHMEIPGLDVTNHACRPNAYIDFRTLCFRALRDIRAGEEITFNYFTTEWDLAHKFQCLCGSPHCLRIIRGFKFLPIEEKERIRKQLSPFLTTKYDEAASEHKPLTLQSLFERQVKSSWGKPALIFGQTTWTYSQLNRRANQWARLLIHKGLADGSRVALLFEPSPEMIVALLAVLKAGSPYVPLDPTDPKPRIRAILANTGASFLLTQKSLKKRIGPIPGISVLCPDPEHTEANRLEDTDLDRTLRPSALAYIIHTSGSTGVPKGVCIRQTAAVNYVTWLTNTLFTGYARIPLLNPIAFDASIEQIFGALLNGGTLLIPRDLRDIPAVAGLIVDQTTAFSIVPSYLNAVIQYWEEHTPGLLPVRKIKTIYIGGEELKSDLLVKMRQVFPQAVIFNGYGPTEATVASHYYKIGKDNKIFLGRPITGVYSLILDAHRQLLPVGVKGEIVIGGAGLAEGYLNDPDLTAEKFIPHPWLPGERLYRTGDCGRYTADGRLEFLGRLDQQVKIRGHRIELGEIESRLRAAGPITDCAVTVKNRPDQEKILVAYYQSKKKLSDSGLRRNLSAQLPDYLIPQHFMRLAKMPLTSSGKIDLRALPEAPTGGADRGRGKPRTPTERKLLPIWQEVLGLPALGIWDDFFHLGGHSLSAMKILVKIRKVFKTSVSLPVFFTNPSIAGLARHIENVRESGRVVVCLQRGRKTRIPFFLIHGAGGEIHAFKELIRGLDRAQPFYALRPENRPVGAPAPSIEALARRYLTEIKALQPRSPYIIGGWSLGGLIACELARLLQSRGAEIAGIILLDTHYTPRRSAQEKPAFYYRQKAKEEIRARERCLATGAPLDLESPDAAQIIATLANHLRAEERYTLKPLEAPLAFISPVAAAAAPEQKKCLAFWRNYAQAGLSVHNAPGNHFSLFEKKHGAKLGALIQRLINGFCAKESGKALLRLVKN